MQVINRRVRDGTATPAEEAAWRRLVGIEQSSSSTSTAQKKEEEEEEEEKDEAASLIPLLPVGGFAGDNTTRAVFLVCLHAQDARHVGRYGSEGQLCSGLCDVQISLLWCRGIFPWSDLSDHRDFPVAPQGD